MKRLVMDTRGGQTLYFGARSSERFGRLYDKGIESKSHKAGLRWRWEVEAKETAARMFADGLKTTASPESYVQGVVAGFFWSRAGVRLAQLEPSGFHKTEHPEPSSARLLHWLASGVRPTVAKLTKVYGRERVLHALGIPLKSAVDGPEHTDEPNGG
jgi:DNA relaxase NicK